ncbi:pilus assembly protein TadG-related protein [Psychromicrobium xiongbiense]|uniref:pilus assembly protein TadG-related protein n=1 Tax=Psychromicrobium xiongbiense TaxID=3051184 RepID=UPI0025522DEE|nr:pilus assembly protein TadG-related protein [Psychromicrobium sp. YIM S02556]
MSGCTRRHLHLAQRTNKGEDGQTMVLIVGYVLLALLVVCTVVALSSVYLEHKKLLSAADGASAAAADGFTLEALSGSAGSTGSPGSTGGAGTPDAALASGRVQAMASRYADQMGLGARFDQFAIGADTGSSDGTTATVTYAAVVHPPILSIFLPSGIQISATSTSRPRLQR